MLRRPAPGMVWVDDADLIQLQGDALRAAELEAQTREAQVQARRDKAEVRASVLLEERRARVGLDVDDQVRTEVLASLPLTAVGVLHEAAFCALVEQLVWSELDAIAAGPAGGAR